jgi:hypothetical protein
LKPEARSQIEFKPEARNQKPEEKAKPETGKPEARRKVKIKSQKFGWNRKRPDEERDAIQPVLAYGFASDCSSSFWLSPSGFAFSSGFWLLASGLFSRWFLACFSRPPAVAAAPGTP